MIRVLTITAAIVATAICAAAIGAWAASSWRPAPTVVCPVQQPVGASTALNHANIEAFALIDKSRAMLAQQGN